VDEVDGATRLAGRGADAAGELGEIVGRVQVVQGLVPFAAIDEVVPVGNLVVHRAAGVTVGHAAVHAARRLLAGPGIAEGNDELVVVSQAVGRGLVPAVALVDLEKTGDLTHGTPRYSAATRWA